MLNTRPTPPLPDSNGPVEAVQSCPADPGQAGVHPPLWNTSDLMRGNQEARITHAGSTYWLRITAMNRLILTK